MERVFNRDQLNLRLNLSNDCAFWLNKLDEIIKKSMRNGTSPDSYISMALAPRPMICVSPSLGHLAQHYAEKLNQAVAKAFKAGIRPDVSIKMIEGLYGNPRPVAIVHFFRRDDVFIDE